MAVHTRRRYDPLMAARVRNIAVNVELPWSAAAGDAVPDAATLGDELRMLWLVEQVRLHRIGVGRGAELSGLPRARFMQLLGEHGVPVIDYAVDDLERELRTLGIG